MSFQTPIFQNLCSVLVTVGHNDSWKHLGKKKRKKNLKVFQAKWRHVGIKCSLAMTWNHVDHQTI